jgi:16S rRNA (guanine527-N7)-methyltransferase
MERPSAAILEQLFAGRTATINRYVDLLTSRGIERGLLGPREAPLIWTRHILNCAVVAPALAPGVSVCDVGSGAGLPGLVLALARPDISVTLLEPLLRRSTFLGEVVDDLELENVVVVRARAEDASGVVRVHTVTARAVAPLDRLAAWAWPLLDRGGEVLAIKGARASEEVATARPRLARLGAVRIGVESYGAGIVDPPTTVVRIESRA